MMTNEEKIRQWGNDSKRREFIRNCKSWDKWVFIKELDMTFYKFEISPEKWLVAAEYISKPFYGESKPGFLYYIHKPGEIFQPYRKQEYELTDLLKEEKMRLLSEKRSTAGK